MKNNSEELYGQFTVNERIELAIAALFRNDMVEVKRLTSTCPKVTCNATNPAFSDKMFILEKYVFYF